mmetsp:Transcript_36060/g.55381  ORF Transcript_36060/g.55381 Transcript_36060/m.55381 type:complete len:94 (-) Transcript_36060:407-688(-)
MIGVLGLRELNHSSGESRLEASPILKMRRLFLRLESVDQRRSTTIKMLDLKHGLRWRFVRFSVKRVTKHLGNGFSDRPGAMNEKGLCFGVYIQ